MIKRFFSTSHQQSTVVDQLESLYQTVQHVNKTSSVLQKKEILTQSSQSCRSLLKRIYDPHRRLYLNSKSVLKYIEKNEDSLKTKPFQEFNQLLDALSSRTIVGYEARKAVAGFYNAYCQKEEHKSIFWKVIDRNLKMGVSENIVRNLISDSEILSSSTIKVALAYPIARLRHFDPVNSPDWYVSRKLDGIRCLSVVNFENGAYNINFLSRTGRKFYSLQKLADALEKEFKAVKIEEDFVLDGEVCVYSEIDNNTEVFREAVSQIRRLKEMKNPQYHVFDFIPMKEFLEGKGATVFSERNARLNTIIGNTSQSYVKVLDQQKIKSVDQLNKMKEISNEKNWEGLMLRRNVYYEGKRTKNLLKIKVWEDAEYTVKSIDTSFIRIPSTGENKLMLKNINIEHKRNIVGVGSGFSMDERIAFAKNPELIIGKTVTVKYFSESSSKNGTVSLRFPTVKTVYNCVKREL